jgi:hypothetical protein
MPDACVAIEEVPCAVDVRQPQVLNYPACGRCRPVAGGLFGFHSATWPPACLLLSSSPLVNPSYFLAPNGVNYAVACNADQRSPA